MTYNKDVLFESFRVNLVNFRVGRDRQPAFNLIRQDLCSTVKCGVLFIFPQAYQSPLGD